MSGLRVLHVTMTASLRASGVAAYVCQLTRALAEEGVVNTVATISDSDLIRDARESLPHVKLLSGTTFPTRSFGVAPRLWRAIRSQMAQADVVHQHGLRNSLVWWTASCARRTDTSLIISPHGQVHPWLLEQRQVRKALVDAFFTRRDLRSAAKLHAVSEPEADDICRYLPGADVATIPIGIDTSPYAPQHDFTAIDVKWPQLADKRVLLYCSLLTPRKGLPLLAEAWTAVTPNFPGWHLAIAGVDAEGYRATVEQDFAREIQSGTASVLGQVTEQEKASLLQQAEMLVLPTLSEAFGIVVLESLASGTPVLTTTGAPWAALPERGCGWWVEPTAEAIAGALDEAMSLSDDERTAMGERGRAMVEREYTWKACARQMVAMYHQVIRSSGGSTSESLCRADQPQR